MPAVDAVLSFIDAQSRVAAVDARGAHDIFTRARRNGDDILALAAGARILEETA